MTTTALPTDPTKLPAGPNRVDIQPLHLSITQTWESGSSRNIHLLENGDLNVILNRGKEGGCQQIPSDAEGTVVITLNVNEDHDEVHYSSLGFSGGAEDDQLRRSRSSWCAGTGRVRVRKS